MSLPHFGFNKKWTDNDPRPASLGAFQTAGLVVTAPDADYDKYRPILINTDDRAAVEKLGTRGNAALQMRLKDAS